MCDPSMGVLRYYSSVTQSGPDSDNDDVITELQRPADWAGRGRARGAGGEIRTCRRGIRARALSAGL